MSEEEECQEQQVLEVEALQAILGAGQAGVELDEVSFDVRGDGSTGSPFRLRCEVDIELPAQEAIDIIVTGGTRTSESYREHDDSSENDGEVNAEVACSKNTSAIDPSPQLELRGIKYLSPLTLYLALPSTYPVTCPPELTIEGLWVDEPSSRRIKAELTRMWEEIYHGGPVIYSWMEWLRHDLMEILLVEPILGREVKEKDANDTGTGASEAPRPGEGEALNGLSRRTLILQGFPPQALFTGHNVDEADWSLPKTTHAEVAPTWQSRFRHLVAHAYAKTSAVFLQSTHTCFICFDEQPGLSFVTLQCGHWWCRSCLRSMASTYVTEGGHHLQWLVCPRPDCALEITPDVLRHELLTSEEFARWERLSLQQALDRMEDVAPCPRCQTPCLTEGGRGREEGSDEGKVDGKGRSKTGGADLGECPTCNFVFCPQCQDAYHAGTPCYSSEARLKQVESEIARLMASTQGGRALAPSQNVRLEKLRRAAEESLSRKVVEKDAKSCPACGMSVQKTEGCNKMRCQCGVLWCWKCRKDISTEGYAHFSENATGGCNLWEREALLAWQRQMLMMEGGGMGNGGGGGDRRRAGGDLHGEMVRMLQWGRGWEGEGPGEGRRRRRGRWRGEDANEDGVKLVRCGACHAMNLKTDSNNHRRCGACRRSYCAVCGCHTFRKASDHFGGSKPCRQHS